MAAMYLINLQLLNSSGHSLWSRDFHTKSLFSFQFDEHTYRICMKHFLVLIVNMTVMWNSGKFNLGHVCSDGNYSQKWITELYNH
jgi:hypothetical protein